MGLHWAMGKGYEISIECRLFCIVRRDSMFFAFRMSPAAYGRGLCDLDRVYRGDHIRVCHLVIA